MIAVVSSNIAYIGHDAETEELRVEFHSGGTYSYSGVPVDVFYELENAGSIGSYFERYIKPNYHGTKL